MLVVMGVPLALISAGTAGCGAGLDDRAHDAEIGLRLARHHAAGGVAEIGAVKAQSNATDHVSDVLLGETRVGASSARGRAIDAVFNAAKKRLAINAGWVWMCRDDLSNSHVDSFLSSADLEANRTQQRPTISTVSLENPQIRLNHTETAKPSKGLEPLTPSLPWASGALSRPSPHDNLAILRRFQ